MAQLIPYPKQLGLFPSFFAAQREDVVLKEKIFSMSGDNFSIKLVSGQPLFQVEGRVFSMSGRKKFMDMQGNHLFTIRKESIALHATFYGEDPNGIRLFEVKSKFSFGTSKAVCSFTSVDGAQERLLMKGWLGAFSLYFRVLTLPCPGNFLASRAQITDEATGQIVAAIDRQYFNSAQVFGDKQTYVVMIAPNVDMALVAAMCICLDEKRSEGN